MEQIDKYEHLKFMVDRFDHYYDSVNNKGAFYIGLNTFIFGGICLSYLSLYEKVEADRLIWVMLIALTLSNLISIFFTIKAIMPFLKSSQQQGGTPSTLYFGGIATYNLDAYKEKFRGLESNDLLEDFIEQAHCLAIGLKDKFKNLTYSGYFLAIQFLLIFPLLILTILSLKP